MSFLPYPPASTTAAIEVFKQDVGLTHEIVHGSDTATVLTEGGEIPTINKLLKDLNDRIGAGTGADITLRPSLAAENSTVLVGGVPASRLSKTVIQVSHLKALPTTNLVDGQQYSVAGFYAGSFVGGGVFVWDATRNKAEHNSVTVVTPESLINWSGSQLTIGSFISHISTGQGAFVRVGSGYLSVFCAGATIEAIDNYNAINNIINIQHLTIDGQGFNFVISKGLVQNNTKLINIKLTLSNSVTGSIVMLTMMNQASVKKLIFDGKNSQKTSVSSYLSVSGLLVKNTEGCSGSEITFEDLGNKTGQTVDGSFAIQIQRDLAATQNTCDNHFDRITVSDSLQRLAFHGRIVTDFQNSSPDQQGFYCFGNSISGIVSTGCGFNNFEICGPDTYDNVISGATVYDANSSDVFDFDHGAYNNKYIDCTVKSVSFGSRSSVNLFSSKETRVDPLRTLNQSRFNTFVRPVVDGIKVSAGKKIRVCSTSYAEDITFEDLKVINTNPSDIVGELNVYESLSFDNVPNTLNQVKLINPRVDYSTKFLNLFGSSSAGGYVYKSLTVKGGDVKCVSAVTTSTATAFFYGTDISGLNLEILGTADNDALRLPRSWNSKIIKNYIKGNTPSGRLYIIGATEGSENIVTLNTFESVAGSTGNVGSVSFQNSLHERNIFVNRVTPGQSVQPVADTSFISELEPFLNQSHSGLQIFDSDKKTMRLWTGLSFQNMPTTRGGNSGTLTFYSGILGSSDIGFQVFNSENDSLNIWNGTTFKRYDSV